MVKLKDVAEKANVSIATASLALNNSFLVNDKTKEKVKMFAKKLNYHPNIAAQRLASGRSYNICIMLNSDFFFKTSNLYYLHVIGGIIKEAETCNYTITFSFYDEHNGDEKFGFLKKNLDSKNIDGAIVFDVIEKDMLEILKKNVVVPIVLVDNHKRFPNVFGVDNDDFGGAYKATKYLIDLGHSRIGYFGIPDKHPLGRECWYGFKKALEEKDLKEVFVYKKCKLGVRSEGTPAIDKIFSVNSILPTAFFCVNDFIAIEIIGEFKKRGFKIPENFSIIGMDDMDLSKDVEPPLTTVKIYMEILGQKSIEKLISIINKNYTGPIKTIIENEIIIRQSCGKLISSRL